MMVPSWLDRESRRSHGALSSSELIFIQLAGSASPERRDAASCAPRTEPSRSTSDTSWSWEAPSHTTHPPADSQTWCQVSSHHQATDGGLYADEKYLGDCSAPSLHDDQRTFSVPFLFSRCGVDPSGQDVADSGSCFFPVFGYGWCITGVQLELCLLLCPSTAPSWMTSARQAPGCHACIALVWRRDRHTW